MFGWDGAMLGIAAAAMIASSVLAYQRGDKWLALLQAAVGLYVLAPRCLEWVAPHAQVVPALSTEPP